MGVQRRVSVIAAVAASVALLSGCSPAPVMPAPMSQEEADRQFAQQREFLWNSKFPREPMPVIAPIEYQDPSSSRNLVDECSQAAGVLDVVMTNTGSWSPVTAPGVDEDAASRAFFACVMEYPYDTSNPGALGLLTDDERSWIWVYNQKRLVPCLQILGYDVDNREGGYIRSKRALLEPLQRDGPSPDDRRRVGAH